MSINHIYKEEVTAIVGVLGAYDCKIVGVDNGDGLSRTTSKTDTINEILAVYDSHLYVKTPDSKIKWLRVILGNNPGKAIVDYSACDVLDEVSARIGNEFVS